jgi:hypothetical protein
MRKALGLIPAPKKKKKTSPQLRKQTRLEEWLEL